MTPSSLRMTLKERCQNSKHRPHSNPALSEILSTSHHASLMSCGAGPCAGSLTCFVKATEAGPGPKEHSWQETGILLAFLSVSLT